MSDKNKIWCNGQFVEVSEQVYKAYMQGDRKERYFSVDLKAERINVNQGKKAVTVIPSREDSLERLVDEKAEQFSDKSSAVEETVINNIMIEKLNNILDKLSSDEKELIDMHYFANISETQLAEKYHVNQSTISRRLEKIRRKLKKLIEN